MYGTGIQEKKIRVDGALRELPLETATEPADGGSFPRCKMPAVSADS